MTTFDDRERAFETRFAQEADLRFRIQARRKKALATWVCQQAGVTGARAAAYQEELLTFAMTAGDDASVATRVAADLAGFGVTLSPSDVRAEMDRLDATASERER